MIIRHRIVAATVLAATVALGSATLADAAIANAMPKGGGDGGWDIEYYEECMAEGQWSPHECCVQSGGHWIYSGLKGEEGKCYSPPANRL